MKRTSAWILATFLTLDCAGPVLAEGEADPTHAGWEALQEIFSPSGPTSPGKCDMAMTLDYDKYQLKMATFRDAWLYKDHPTEYYQRRGHTILVIIARKAATAITQGVFTLKDRRIPESCRFRFFVSDQD